MNGCRRLWIIVLVMTTGAACGHEAPPPVETPPPLLVRVVTVSESMAPEFTSVVATVQPLRRVTPGTKLLGRVVSLEVSEGDRVNQGDILARIESADLDARLGQARGAVGQAEARLENTALQLGRMEQLLAQQAATQQQFDNARTERDLAAAALESARGALREVEANMTYSEVTSPVSGVVARTLVEPGDMAQPGQGLLVLEETRQMKVIAEVNEQDIARVHKNMKLEVVIPALRDTVIIGTVDAVLPTADRTARSFQVQVLIANPANRIRSGMFARVRLQSGLRRSLLVPDGAIYRRGQLEGVFVVSAGTARLRWLRLGKRHADGWEVVSGLRSGAQIVAELTEGLRDGSPVEVVHE